MPRKLTTKEWVLKAIGIHGSRYDYSDVNYSKADDKVSIKCNKCGSIFTQTAYRHLQGNGCPNQCFVVADRQVKFIEKANKAHNNKYNYNLVNYKHSRVKVSIICPVHGLFEQTPYNHLISKGCQKCHLDEVSMINSFDTELFINKAKKVHGNKYSYDKTIYVANETKVTITCPKHGDFLITPHNFLTGANCQLCAREAVYTKSVKSVQEFIQDSVRIHGDKYDYSLVEYVNNKTPVKLLCKYHNSVFNVRPDSHLFNKSGCSECNLSGTSKAEKSLLSWLNSLGYDFKPSNIPGSKLKLDMYNRNLGIAIEYNGTYWHSTKQKDDNYHLDKYLLCKANNIILIHIFEFEDLIKWKKKLASYLRNIDKYEILYKNNKRTVNHKNSKYTCYGQSYIKCNKFNNTKTKNV